MIFTSPNLEGQYFWIYGSTLLNFFEHIVHIMDISNDTKTPSNQIDNLQNYNNTCTWF